MQPFFLCAWSQKAGHCLHGVHGQSQASTTSCPEVTSGPMPSLPPPWTPGVLKSSHCLPPRLQKWSPTAATITLADSRKSQKLPPLPLQTLGPHLSCHYCQEPQNWEPATTSSQVAEMVKNLPAMQETWVRSLGWEDPLEKGMATHSSILAWRI